MTEPTPRTFEITYETGQAARSSGYYVSIPNYHGGTVWTDDAYDALRQQRDDLLEAIREWWEDGASDDHEMLSDEMGDDGFVCIACSQDWPCSTERLRAFASGPITDAETGTEDDS